MLDLFFSGPSTLTIVLLGAILLVYFVKEWLMNLGVNQTNIPHTESEKYDWGETGGAIHPEEPLEQLRESKVVKEDERNGVQLQLTDEIIQALLNFDQANWWVKMIIQRLVPKGDGLEQLKQYAQDGKLSAGMMVRIRDGKVMLPF